MKFMIGDFFSSHPLVRETQPAAPLPQAGFTFCRVQNDPFTVQRKLLFSFLKCIPTNPLTSIPLLTITWVSSISQVP